MNAALRNQKKMSFSPKALKKTQPEVKGRVALAGSRKHPAMEKHEAFYCNLTLIHVQ